MAGIRDNLVVGLENEDLPTPQAPKLLARVFHFGTTFSQTYLDVAPGNGFAVVRGVGAGAPANTPTTGQISAGAGGDFASRTFEVAEGDRLLSTVGLNLPTLVRRNDITMMLAREGQPGTGLARPILTDGGYDYGVDGDHAPSGLSQGDIVRRGQRGYNRDGFVGSLPLQYSGGAAGSDASDNNTLNIVSKGAVATPGQEAPAQGYGAGGVRNGSVFFANTGGMVVIEFYSGDPR